MFLFQFRNALLPSSRSHVAKIQTTVSRLRPSHARTSSQEFKAGVSLQKLSGTLTSKRTSSSRWLHPNQDLNSKATQCNEDLTSSDSHNEDLLSVTDGATLKQPCSGVVFKASPSRRQVKAVIFERREDGEPTVTVIMTRENGDGSSSSDGSKDSCCEAADQVVRKTFVSKRSKGRSASVTFSVQQVEEDGGHKNVESS